MCAPALSPARVWLSSRLISLAFMVARVRPSPYRGRGIRVRVFGSPPPQRRKASLRLVGERLSVCRSFGCVDCVKDASVIVSIGFVFRYA